MKRWIASLFYLPCDFGAASGVGCWRRPRWWSDGLQTRLPDGWQRTLYWCAAHRPDHARPLDKNGDHLP